MWQICALRILRDLWAKVVVNLAHRLQVVALRSKFYSENDFTTRSQALWLQSQFVSVMSLPGRGDCGHQPHYHLGPEEP